MTTFLDELTEAFQANRNKKSHQESAWKRFLAISLPSKRQENYRHLPLQDLYSRKLCLKGGSDITDKIPSLQSPSLIFVDGVLRNEKTLEEIKVFPFSKAFDLFSGFLPADILKSINTENEVFSLLNGAFAEEGSFIYLPPNTRLDKPLELLFVQSGEFSNPKIHLFLSKESRCHLKIKNLCLGDKAKWQNGFIDITLEEGASCDLTHLVEGDTKSWVTFAFRVKIKKKASFNSISVTKGGKVIREDFKISLLEEEASANLEGFSKLEGSSQSHIHIEINHIAPFTRSFQKFKKVLTDQALASFDGKIKVMPQALKTEAFQVNQNLVLSDDVRCFSKPNLEILADDVKASHGATVGQIEEEDLFYFKARGISEAEAKKLLIDGFGADILAKVDA